MRDDEIQYPIYLFYPLDLINKPQIAKDILLFWKPMNVPDFQKFVVVSAFTIT